MIFSLNDLLMQTIFFWKILYNIQNLWRNYPTSISFEDLETWSEGSMTLSPASPNLELLLAYVTSDLTYPISFDLDLL